MDEQEAEAFELVVYGDTDENFYAIEDAEAWADEHLPEGTLFEVRPKGWFDRAAMKRGGVMAGDGPTTEEPRSGITLDAMAFGTISVLIDRAEKVAAWYRENGPLTRYASLPVGLDDALMDLDIAVIGYSEVRKRLNASEN